MYVCMYICYWNDTIHPIPKANELKKENSICFGKYSSKYSKYN